MTMKPLCALLLGLGLSCANAQAGSRYTINDLSFLTPGDRFVRWEGINEAGDLVGQGGAGVLTYIGGTLAADASYGGVEQATIGNNGTVLFNAPEPMAASYVYKAYTIKNGVTTQLPLTSPDGLNYVTAINNAGVTVGGAADGVHCGESGSCDGTHRAAIFGAGAPTVLGTLPGHAESMATAINNRGAIVGWSGNSAWGGASFIYQNGTMRNLNVGTESTVPVAINDAGQIAGTYWRGVEGYGSWVMRNGAVEYFGLDHEHTSVVDLNNAGQLIGNSGAIPSERAWIREGGQLTMLDELLHDDGWSVLQVYALNDKGQIVAQVRRPDGQQVFAVLTPDEPPVLLPVPEPGSYAMLAAGLGVMAVWRRRRATA
ncbi:PEP-CTERM sorting domain-containing protein [Pseudoduganella chitinolytica]|uniref:PEP-CTERM sorting domain-containing protein n=1 Tax=Pseudoduganella chitinolytica TaxID=34070 RepID=A0ABY8BFQ8_9BURK|nr:PEP-CTERM sorting domain-containing protein [Pseudoduganella chitinolytica]WEF34739.1 PEP-CTERM sorting domain-containing protein [Pseudoduganella chitinolytica]